MKKQYTKKKLVLGPETLMRLQLAAAGGGAANSTGCQEPFTHKIMC